MEGLRRNHDFTAITTEGQSDVLRQDWGASRTLSVYIAGTGVMLTLHSLTNIVFPRLFKKRNVFWIAVFIQCIFILCAMIGTVAWNIVIHTPRSPFTLGVWLALLSSATGIAVASSTVAQTVRLHQVFTNPRMKIGLHMMTAITLLAGVGFIGTHVYSLAPFAYKDDQNKAWIYSVKAMSEAGYFAIIMYLVSIGADGLFLAMVRSVMLRYSQAQANQPAILRPYSVRSPTFSIASPTPKYDSSAVSQSMLRTSDPHSSWRYIFLMALKLTATIAATGVRLVMSLRTDGTEIAGVALVILMTQACIDLYLITAINDVVASWVGNGASNRSLTRSCRSRYASSQRLLSPTATSPTTPMIGSLPLGIKPEQSAKVPTLRNSRTQWQLDLSHH